MPAAKDGDRRARGSSLRPSSVDRRRRARVSRLPVDHPRRADARGGGRAATRPGALRPDARRPVLGVRDLVGAPGDAALIAELTRPTVLSDRALRNLAQLKRAHGDYLQRHGREPTGAQLAADTDLTHVQVGELLALERLPRSMDEPVRGVDGELGAFGELLADPLAEDAYERLLDRARSNRCEPCSAASTTANARSSAPATGSTATNNHSARWASGSGYPANAYARSRARARQASRRGRPRPGTVNLAAG